MRFFKQALPQDLRFLSRRRHASQLIYRRTNTAASALLRPPPYKNRTGRKITACAKVSGSNAGAGLKPGRRAVARHSQSVAHLPRCVRPGAFIRIRRLKAAQQHFISYNFWKTPACTDPRRQVCSSRSCPSELLRQFFQPTTCERRFRTDAQNEPAPAILPLNEKQIHNLRPVRLFSAGAGEKEQTNLRYCCDKTVRLRPPAA